MLIVKEETEDCRMLRPKPKVRAEPSDAYKNLLEMTEPSDAYKKSLEMPLDPRLKAGPQE